MTELTIRTILNDTRTGNMQTVGIMQMIPLMSDHEFKGFVSPVQAGEMRTSNYGSMEFSNRSSDDTMIVPSHSTYIVKQAAQDHALPHAGIVKKKATKTYQTAACVQSEQGGTISKGVHNLDIMPFALREGALAVRDVPKYDKLWSAIGKFNVRFKLPQGNQGHLEYFYQKFEKELNEFIAEFEIIPKQIGAIILINGFVVGIERAPTYEYWTSIWPSLIRGCYGSLVLQYQHEKFLDDKDINKIRTPLNITKITTLDELESELNKTEQTQYNKVKEIVEKLLDDKFVMEKDETVEKLNRHNISNDQFTGQAIIDTDIADDAVIYSSLITKDKWFKQRNYKKNTFNL